MLEHLLKSSLDVFVLSKTHEKQWFSTLFEKNLNTIIPDDIVLSFKYFQQAVVVALLMIMIF